MAIDIEAIEQELHDNCDFEEVGSVAKANAFVTAAKRLLAFSPESSSNEGSSLSFNRSALTSLLDRAQQYIAVTSGKGSRTRFLSVSGGFRGW